MKTLSPVLRLRCFFYDLEWNIQQADEEGVSRLLPVDMNPPYAILRLRNIIY